MGENRGQGLGYLICRELCGMCYLNHGANSTGNIRPKFNWKTCLVTKEAERWRLRRKPGDISGRKLTVVLEHCMPVNRITGPDGSCLGRGDLHIPNFCLGRDLHKIFFLFSTKMEPGDIPHQLMLFTHFFL